jgi:hypothetical protein
MSFTPKVSHSHSHSHTPGVDKCHQKEKSTFDVIINALEKISAVALGVFSCYVNWKLFVPYFFIGMTIGVYSYLQNNKSNDHVHAASSCANGLVEQLTGVKLPPVVSLAANLAVTVCHIDHHASVFVPVIGVSLGAWVGKSTCHYGEMMQKKIALYFDKKSMILSPAS